MVSIKLTPPIMCSDFIIFYEKYALLKLSEHYNISPNKITHVSENDAQSPYDLLYNCDRYDVKISSPVYAGGTKKKKIWDFDIRNKKGDCDYYLLLGMLNGLPQKAYLIKEKETPKRHVRISIDGHSKYHQYEI